jgi:hypothetical protein
VLEALERVLPSRLIPGGGRTPPPLGFPEQSCLDELFLTLAPQVAGRNGLERLGLVAGRAFAPHHPVWATLIDVRRAEATCSYVTDFPRTRSPDLLQVL